MRVGDVMTGDVGFCGLATNLAEAAVTMWQRDCGVVPVVDDQKKVVGMITDRDICMAVATKNRAAAQISVSEVVSGKVFACRADDNAESALKIMRRQQLRRLAVIDADGVLVGVLSISDCLRHAGKGKQKISRKKIFAALEAISSFHPIHLREIAAEQTVETAAGKLSAKPARRARKQTTDANENVLNQTADDKQSEIFVENLPEESNRNLEPKESALNSLGANAANSEAPETAEDK